MPSTLTVRVYCPSPFANSSPKLKTVMERARTIAMISPTTATGMMILILLQFTPATPPAYQKLISCATSNRMAIAEEIELKSAPTAVPANASFTGVSPPFERVPTPNTIEAPSAAPKNDQRINVKEDWPGKKANAMAIANAEPFVTPMISGAHFFLCLA